VDLLLIGRVNYDRFQMMTDALRTLEKMNYAFDVMFLTSNEFEKHKNIPGTVARYAFKEGKILYEKINQDMIKLVQEWIDIAEEDFKLAEHGMSISSGISYRIIAFHSQQCAEKYLKAYLVFKNIEFPYTHNITTLLDLCSSIDESFEKLRDADILTSYATALDIPVNIEN
jgi:HEPN domain-containing protein